MSQLPGQEVDINDFISFQKYGFSQTIFNGLKIGDLFEYRSDLDKRVLVMKVSEITFDEEQKPILTISHVRRMYCRK